MARYIDGTWLKKFFEADKGKGRTTPIDSLLALIDDAPTAECFTCGMERVKDEKYGSLPTLVYDPEDVPDEVLEANDRLVSLADVCKLIKREWQINPHQWGELARLPQTDLVKESPRLVKDLVDAFCEDGTWLERQGIYTLTLAEAKQRAVGIIEAVSRKDEADVPQTDCEACRHNGEYAYCRLCGRPGEDNYEPRIAEGSK